MTRRIVVLSGRIASGKSSLAGGLTQDYNAVRVSTRELLLDYARKRGGAVPSGRDALQVFGTDLDTNTNGQWIVDALIPVLAKLPSNQVVVVDSVRLAAQLDALRATFGRTVLHVHLTASEADLQSRFDDRADGIDVGKTYGDVSADLTERQVETLADVADLHANTSITDVRDILVRTAAKIGALSPIDAQLVDVLVGGQYGSEGKGNLAYYLAPEYDILLRVGGPNAGHKVPTDPVVTHRSLPSGALANVRAPLYVGAGAVISPTVLQAELADSGVSPERVFIDPQAMVISDDDVRAELDLRAAIGSTGQGVGAASARKITGRSGTTLRLAKDTPVLKQFVNRPRFDAVSFRVWKEDVDHAEEDSRGDEAARGAAGS